MPTGQLVITRLRLTAPWSKYIIVTVLWSRTRRVSHARCTAILKVDRWWSLQLVRTGHNHHIVHDSLLSALSPAEGYCGGRNHKLGPLCCHGWKPRPSNKSSPFAEKPGLSQNMAKLLSRHYQEFQSSLVLSGFYRCFVVYSPSFSFSLDPFFMAVLPAGKFSVWAGPGIKSTPWAEQSLSRLPWWVPTDYKRH